MCVVGAGSMVFMFTSLTSLVDEHQMKKAQLKKSKKWRNGGARVGRSRSRDPQENITHVGEDECEVNSGETSERLPQNAGEQESWMREKSSMTTRSAGILIDSLKKHFKRSESIEN